MTNWIGIASKNDIHDIARKIQSINAKIELLSKGIENNSAEINYMKLNLNIPDKPFNRDMALTTFSYAREYDLKFGKASSYSFKNELEKQRDKLYMENINLKQDVEKLSVQVYQYEIKNNKLKSENEKLKCESANWNRDFVKAQLSLENEQLRKSNMKLLRERYIDPPVAEQLEKLQSEVKEWKAKHECEYEENRKLAIDNHNLKKELQDVRNDMPVIRKLNYLIHELKIECPDSIAMSPHEMIEKLEWDLKSGFAKLKSENQKLKSENQNSKVEIEKWKSESEKHKANSEFWRTSCNISKKEAEGWRKNYYETYEVLKKNCCFH